MANSQDEWVRMILPQLEQIWKTWVAWPGFLQAMQSLFAGITPQSKQGEHLLTKWLALPGLCCEAAGGQADWADDLAAAWMVLYGAAYVMDAVEDNDKPDPEWAWMSPGMAVNAASGLYFSASIILENLRNQPATRGAAGQVILDFYQGFLTMSSGQHRDLTTPRPSLNDYWEIATSKSGTFFSMACCLGARLADGSPERLKGFHEFGLKLGLAIQILDDIEDVQKAPAVEAWSGLYKSLPVIYAFQSAPPRVRARLENLLRAGPAHRKAGDELLDLIDESGAVRFLLSEYERLKKEAIQALEYATPLPSYQEKLLAYLPAIY
jgi:geranylgeranyl pyrophosphate synthase